MYTYEDLQEGQIRLLILKPAQDEKADICIELKSHTFEEIQENYEFAALSYHWGDGAPEKPVFVRDPHREHMADVVLRTMYNSMYDDNTGKRLYVKPNLYKAWRCLRQKKDDIALWIDAICIYSDRSIIKHFRNLR